ncbi:hypothetical protein EMPS_10510 [Entomortierella parvispora]|uniref:Lysine-specific metallo-endopeptidase domain-containing protein n=1 Tax=Entomortierella parvispora TaxID=205924 RepID=A0A9P3HK77_9FUNG|nr:hypothetical protein EMPS_10510 [Entomortierella parvispora]
MKLVSMLMFLPLVANAATSFTGCSIPQQSQLNAAISAAQSYISAASAYIDSHNSATPRYTTWFGTFTASRHGAVASIFGRLKWNNLASFTYDCSTCHEPNEYAYVYPNQFGKIYLCGSFWRAPLTGTDSKAGTLISQASTFTQNGGAEAYDFSQKGCKHLANVNPEGAVQNADNYQYFAENNPPLS